MAGDAKPPKPGEAEDAMKPAPPKPAMKKDTDTRKVRRERFAWAPGDIEWVVSPEDAAKAKKTDGDAKKPDGDAKPQKKEGSS